MKERFELYLNGKFYGSGPRVYMRELISDWIVTNNMYGKDQCEFKIVRVK